MKGAVTAAIAVLSLLGSAPAQNLFKNARDPRALIADLRARNVGDILTITVTENHKVRNEDKVNRTNSTNLAARFEDYTLSSDTFKTNILPKIDIRQARSMTGGAKQEKDSQFTASIAVIVVDVQPNGNLVIAGSRLVIVDDERKTLKISGIVRPLDVAKSNTITSMQVADARISMEGEGANTRMVTRGPLGTIFDTLIWAAWPF